MGTEIGTIKRSLPSSPVYTVGTLVYTRMGLAGLFVWLLWGDFCCMLMNSVAPTLVPLSLKDAGASNLLIALVTGTIPAAMNMGLNPIISTISDRFRSRYGRRIPFLFWSAPFITLFMILAGFSQPIGLWFHRTVLTGWAGVSPSSVVLFWTCVFFLGFQFFDLFLNIIYYYLFADVVPEAVLGRFLSLFRVVSQSAGILWSAFIFGYAETYSREIYLGLGLLYLISFTLMCWKVKEGDYPPPPPRTHGPGLAGAVRTYVNECYRHGFYLYVFAFSVCISLSWCASKFAIFFARDELKLSLDQIGKIDALSNLVSLPFYFLFGWLCDRVHPIRILFLSLIVSSAVTLVSFWTIHDRNTYLYFTLATIVVNSGFAVAFMPLGMLLYPKDRYGQFCSAQALLSALAGLTGTFLAGWFFDRIGEYRYTLIWRTVFQVSALVPLVFIYYGWRRHGGRSFVAPPVAAPQQ